MASSGHDMEAEWARWRAQFANFHDDPGMPLWRAFIIVVGAAALLVWSMAACGAETRELPDLALTPGVATSASTGKICNTKWGKDRRHVTPSLKRAVLDRYGGCSGHRCEIDHLIPRELGGADEIANLWPQPYGGEWGAEKKDRVENRLRREVCASRIDLLDAQRDIARDWREVYRRYWP